MQVRLKRVASSVAVCVLLGVTACGGLRAAGGPDPPEAPGAGQQLNWEQPVPGSNPISSADEAALAFTPNVPDRLGSPHLIVATDPQHAPPPFREIAWVYRHSDYGLFMVRERLVESEVAVSEWRHLASETPGCSTIPPDPEHEAKYGSGAGPIVQCHYGERTLLTIGGGLALLIEGEVTTSLTWLEPVDGLDTRGLEGYEESFRLPLSVEITVMGPAEELTGDEAVALAERV